METNKKPTSEVNKPASSEASTSKNKKEKPNPAHRPEHRIHVPLEVMAEDQKLKTDKEKQKSKKSKKIKSKKTSSDSIKIAKESKQPGLTTPEQPTLPKKADGERGIFEPEGASEKTEPIAQEVKPHAEAAPHIEESFESIILPHEMSEDEGDLFISPRLLRSSSEAESSDEVAPDLEDYGDVEQIQEAPSNTTEDEPDSEDPAMPPATVPRVAAKPHRPPMPVGTTAGAPASAAASRAGGTPPPVHPPLHGGNLPPPNLPPSNPNLAPFSPAAPNVVPVAAAAVPQVERVPYRSRTGERRNLVAGLLIGGIIEHVRHKRREKRTKIAHEKEIKQLKTEQQGQQLHAEQKAARTKTALENQIERLKRQEHIPKPHKEQPEKQRKEHTVQPVAETLQQPVQQRVERERNEQNPLQNIKSAEYIAAANVPTLVKSQENLSTPEKPAPIPKQQPENIDEPVEIPADRRVESSAWHRIEVDKKTGKVVEDPSLAYGHEFQQEQHQEQLRREIDEASVDSETVKQAYMPTISRASSSQHTSVNVAPKSSPRQSSNKSSSLLDVAQKARDKASDSSGVDIALWLVFFLIVIAIIALL